MAKAVPITLISFPTYTLEEVKNVAERKRKEDGITTFNVKRLMEYTYSRDELISLLNTANVRTLKAIMKYIARRFPHSSRADYKSHSPKSHFVHWIANEIERANKPAFELIRTIKNDSPQPATIEAEYRDITEEQQKATASLPDTPALPAPEPVLSELKPCPKCGSTHKPYIKNCKHNNFGFSRKMGVVAQDHYYRITCRDCGHTVTASYYRHGYETDNGLTNIHNSNRWKDPQWGIEEAIMHWNIEYSSRPERNMTISNKLVPLYIPARFSQDVFDDIEALYCNARLWSSERRGLNTIFEYITSNKVTVKSLRLFAKKLGYFIAPKTHKNSIARALIPVIQHIHHTMKLEREKSIAAAFPLGVLEYPRGTVIDEKLADMRNDFRISLCNSPLELQSLLSASDKETLELLGRRKGIKASHAGILVALFVARTFPQICYKPHALPALPSHQPARKPEHVQPERKEHKFEIKPPLREYNPKDIQAAMEANTHYNLYLLKNCKDKEQARALLMNAKKVTVCKLAIDLHIDCPGHSWPTKAILADLVIAHIFNIPPAHKAQSTAKPTPPTTHEKTRTERKHSLTIEAVNSCSNRDELTALFSKFKKEEVSAFMLSIGVSLRGLKGLGSKAKLASYCSAKVLYLRSLKPQHHTAPKTEKQPEAKKPQTVITKHGQLMFVF